MSHKIKRLIIHQQTEDNAGPIIFQLMLKINELIDQLNEIISPRPDGA